MGETIAMYNVHSKKDMEEKEDSLNTKACGGENSTVSDGTVSDDTKMYKE